MKSKTETQTYGHTDRQMEIKEVTQMCPQAYEGDTNTDTDPTN